MAQIKQTAFIFLFLLSLSGCGQTLQQTNSETTLDNSTDSTEETDDGIEQSGTDQNNNDDDSSANFQTQDEQEVAEDDAAVPEPDAPLETDPPVDSAGLLFGFWALNGYISSIGFADLSTRFGMTLFQVASEAPHYTVSTLLPLVRASNIKVTLRMTSYPDYSGDFDLETWKTDLDAWIDSGVQEFIDDGTLVGHMLLDDIDTFAGTNPTASDLDEMARYSQEIMPGLMTFVRQKATWMPVPDGGTYLYLDACVNQYSAYPGFPDDPVEEYVVEQAAAAEALGLEIINGMNIADGGNGSSGQPGWSKGKHAMSAEEITTYGEALLGAPDLLMFLMWEYDGEQVWPDGTVGSDYFDQSEQQEAIFGLSQIAAAYETPNTP